MHGPQSVDIGELQRQGVCAGVERASSQRPVDPVVGGLVELQVGLRLSVQILGRIVDDHGHGQGIGIVVGDPVVAENGGQIADPDVIATAHGDGDVSGDGCREARDVCLQGDADAAEILESADERARRADVSEEAPVVDVRPGRTEDDHLRLVDDEPCAGVDGQGAVDRHRTGDALGLRLSAVAQRQVEIVLRRDGLGRRAVVVNGAVIIIQIDASADRGECSR